MHVHTDARRSHVCMPRWVSRAIARRRWPLRSRPPARVVHQPALPRPRGSDRGCVGVGVRVGLGGGRWPSAPSAPLPRALRATPTRPPTPPSSLCRHGGAVRPRVQHPQPRRHQPGCGDEEHAPPRAQARGARGGSRPRLPGLPTPPPLPPHTPAPPPPPTPSHTPTPSLCSCAPRCRSTVTMRR